MWKLFLDDLRNPWGDLGDYSSKEINQMISAHDNDWWVARSFDEAVNMVYQNGCPNFISFDHDLGIVAGVEKSGNDFAKWFVQQVRSHNFNLAEDFQFTVHSQNPVGRQNIINTMSDLKKK